jgi:hypothetical protein
MTLQGTGDISRIAGASDEFNQFIADTRLFMRDFPELNRLVAGVESSDRMIAFCAIEAISDFNSTPPHIGRYGFSSFVENGWIAMLRLGTLCNLLTSVGLLQTRNHLPFSDGGLNVSVSDKTPLLQSWIQLICNKWENQKQQVKVAQNIAQLLDGSGGIASELFDIHGYYAEVY